MTRSSFISKLVTFNHDSINEYIKEHGKRKEPKSYYCPWYIDLNQIMPLHTDNLKGGYSNGKCA